MKTASTKGPITLIIWLLPWSLKEGWLNTLNQLTWFATKTDEDSLSVGQEW